MRPIELVCTLENSTLLEKHPEYRTPSRLSPSQSVSSNSVSSRKMTSNSHKSTVDTIEREWISWNCAISQHEYGAQQLSPCIHLHVDLATLACPHKDIYSHIDSFINSI